MFFTDHFVMQLHMNEFFYHAAVSFFYKDEKKILTLPCFTVNDKRFLNLS